MCMSLPTPFYFAGALLGSQAFCQRIFLLKLTPLRRQKRMEGEKFLLPDPPRTPAGLVPKASSRKNNYPTNVEKVRGPPPHARLVPESLRATVRFPGPLHPRGPPPFMGNLMDKCTHPFPRPATRLQSGDV